MRTTRTKPAGPDPAEAVAAEAVAAEAVAAEAVATLYQLHYPSLVRLAALLVPDPAIAEDIVQEAFAALHGERPALPGTDAALARLRRWVVRRSRSASSLRPAAGTGVPGSAVMSALRTLPARQREVVVLRYFADLPEGEIAAATGLSAAAVRHHAVRAMSSLQAGLGPAGRGTVGGHRSRASRGARRRRGAGMEEFTVPEITADDHVLGPAGAPVTVLEYGDYECPYCRGAARDVRRMLDLYPGSIRFAFRNFPIQQLHPHAEQAAEAAEAAAAQDKFWEMYELLLEPSSSLDLDSLLSYARDLGLDTDRFRQDVTGRAYTAKIDGDVREGLRNGVNATPKFYVDGERIDGKYPLEGLEDAIRAAVRAAAPA